MLYVVVCI